VRECTGFDFDCGPSVPATAEPSRADLALLRAQVAREIAANYPAFGRRVWELGASHSNS
jgi:hypothetical protein